MPRQGEDPDSVRSAKRRRSPQREQSPAMQNATLSENNTPLLDKPNSRKRMREADLPSSRAPKRARSPLTSSHRADRRDPSPPPREPSRSPPRKRPGAGARISAAARQAAEEKRRQREEDERRAAENRAPGPVDMVSAHYNAVPERGREWRKTDSQIKGLRSLNNWVKSTIIQKFSQPDIPTPNLLVLDMGCGKGGDLMKWQSAPQTPRLYVGVDPAEVSIKQARDRYEEMLKKRRGPRGRPQRLYEAHFYVQDAFGESLEKLPTVREVGFDPRAGPDAQGNITGRFSTGGFDVISMMFCLHYSFETEAKARGMLKNVAGALKKGGRFLGVMPNSDVISAKVEEYLKKDVVSKKPLTDSPPKMNDDDDWDPERPIDQADGAGDDDDWDPEKPMAGGANGASNDDDDWDPEKPLDAGLATASTADEVWDREASLDTSAAQQPAASTAPATKTPAQDEPPLEWGNSIYTVKFPRTRPLPADGVFRPPYGWKYFYYLEEAVDVPEFVVPWEGFRALAEDYGLELLYRKPFPDVWEEEKDDPILGPLSERMGVRDRSGRVNVSKEEMEAAAFYHAFCFYKI
ncbi:mRNA capping enzyme-domain-containing protein [Delphinella strobiligena]|nr:mRNA capping enzyme-domain-containing protein [Delphinella strobiligena]